MPSKFILLVLQCALTTTLYAQAAAVPVLDGKFLYEEYAGCGSCHGNDGKGEVEGVPLDPPPPDLTDCSFNSREPRRDWRAVINHGGQARGLSMSMPSYGEALNAEQVEAVIDHLKTFCTEADWPPGELNFRRAHLTTKAFPENEAVLVPQYTRGSNQNMRTKFVYERRVGKRGQWEIAVPFAAEWQAPRANGLGDIELSAKYVLAFNARTRAIMSGGLEAALPTGETAIGLGNGAWKLTPFLAAGKGFEHFTLQSSVKLEQPLHRDEGESELFFNFAFTLPLTPEKKGLIPMLETQGVRNLESGATQWFLAPQLYIGLVRRGHIALSFAGQIPLAGERPFDYRLLSFFLWEYADGGLWW